MGYATDLAGEWLGAKKKIPQGVEVVREEPYGIPLTRVTVKRSGLAKAPGVYTTLQPPALDGPHPQECTAELLKQELKKLLLPADRVLVVGLGNPFVTADSLGPRMLRGIWATRHLRGSVLVQGLALREVACFAPGVEAATGIATLEAVKGICAAVKPDKVLCVDSLCAASVKSIGRTIQLSDAGLSPGRGETFTAAALGVPVVALGAPTVARVSGKGASMALTSQSVDVLVRRAASLFADAVNAVLHPALTKEELQALLS